MQPGHSVPGIATYSEIGAQFGYGQLWTALWMLPPFRRGNTTARSENKELKVFTERTVVQAPRPQVRPPARRAQAVQPEQQGQGVAPVHRPGLGGQSPLRRVMQA
jgi:hypothetical protein